MWYIEYQGKQKGPFSEEQLIQIIRSGRVSGSNLVWTEGMPSWCPLSETKLAVCLNPNETILRSAGHSPTAEKTAPLQNLNSVRSLENTTAVPFEIVESSSKKNSRSSSSSAVSPDKQTSSKTTSASATGFFSIKETLEKDTSKDVSKNTEKNTSKPAAQIPAKTSSNTPANSPTKKAEGKKTSEKKAPEIESTEKSALKNLEKTETLSLGNADSFQNFPDSLQKSDRLQNIDDLQNIGSSQIIGNFQNTDNNQHIDPPKKTEEASKIDKKIPLETLFKDYPQFGKFYKFSRIVLKYGLFINGILCALFVLIEVLLPYYLSKTGTNEILSSSPVQSSSEVLKIELINASIITPFLFLAIWFFLLVWGTILDFLTSQIRAELNTRK